MAKNIYIQNGDFISSSIKLNETIVKKLTKNYMVYIIILTKKEMRRKKIICNFASNSLPRAFLCFCEVLSFAEGSDFLYVCRVMWLCEEGFDKSARWKAYGKATGTQQSRFIW